MIEVEENGSTAAPVDQPSQVTAGVFDGLSIDTAEQDHFATDHLLTGLKERAVSSGVVTMVAQGAQFVLTLASTMVLARLLTPQDFGLVAMVTTVIGFFRIFNDAGLSTATVQREGITHAQVSNLFWTNVMLGVAITLLLAICAPVVARFYHEPRLVNITLALCLTFLFTTSAVQHMALLKRQMRFKAIALIQVSSMAAGILTGIGMALLKCGSWSLVGMQLATPMLALILTWSASRWRPQLPTRRSGTRSLLSFGANLTASSFLWSLARGSDSLLIGRFFGSAPLGLYTRAAALLNRPLEQAMGPLEAVFVPTFSRLQAQPERYRRMAFQVYDSMAVGSFPIAGMLLALAHPLTLVVLGPKWESAAMIFAGFTLVALYVPIASVAGWLLSSQGRGRDYMVLSSIVSSVTVLFFLVGLRFGPVGVAMSYSVIMPPGPVASCLLYRGPAGSSYHGRFMESVFHAFASLGGGVRCDLAHPYAGQQFRSRGTVAHLCPFQSARGNCFCLCVSPFTPRSNESPDCASGTFKIPQISLVENSVARAATSSAQAPKSHPMRTPQKFCGTFVRKERWGLSWWGWLIVLAGVILAFFAFLLRVYPFLAVTHRLDTNVLVVEGWIHDYAIRAAVEEFRSKSYERAFTTGGPVEGAGGYINDYNTAASVGADLLRKNGLPDESLQMVPSRVIDRDRTYGSAVALRNWFREHNLPVRSINVVTEDVHARRTRLLFEKALGNNVAVGIVAVPNPDYDARRWWRYSEGVKDVFAESVAYIYAQIFFHPSKTEAKVMGQGTEIKGRLGDCLPAYKHSAPTALQHSAPESKV